jgi:hypothetical protein
MRKIPTLYVRDPATKLRYVLDEVHPDCQWVIDGEGVATYKWDGTAVLVDSDRRMWKRREVKPGKATPEGFRQEGDADSNTGKLVGWVPCRRGRPEDQWHWQAFDNAGWTEVPGQPAHASIDPGTYELIGPKARGNPHQLASHCLMPHGRGPDLAPPTDFDALGRWLHAVDTDMAPPGFEGIVWHHPDGRMAKIKLRDFPEAGAVRMTVHRMSAGMPILLGERVLDDDGVDRGAFVVGLYFGVDGCGEVEVRYPDGSQCYADHDLVRV